MSGSYLVWSHEHGMWWGPNHRGYRSQILFAGRYTEAEAQKICNTRGWRSPVEPPEVMVLAPEAEPIPDGTTADAEMDKRIRAATGKVLTADPFVVATAYLDLRRKLNGLTEELEDLAISWQDRACAEDVKVEEAEALERAADAVFGLTSRARAR